MRMYGTMANNMYASWRFFAELRQDTCRNFRKFVTSRTKQGGHAAYIAVSGKAFRADKQGGRNSVNTTILNRMVSSEKMDDNEKI